MTSPKQLEAIRAVEQLFPVGSKVLLKYSASDEMEQVTRHEHGPQRQRLLQHAGQVGGRPVPLAVPKCKPCQRRARVAAKWTMGG